MICEDDQSERLLLARNLRVVLKLRSNKTKGFCWIAAFAFVRFLQCYCLVLVGGKQKKNFLAGLVGHYFLAFLRGKTTIKKRDRKEEVWPRSLWWFG